MTTERKTKRNVPAAVRNEVNELVLERTAELSSTIQRLELELAQRQRVESALRRVLADERRQIGEELREGIGQDLAGTMLILGALANRTGTGTNSVSGELLEIATLLEGVLARTCALSRDFGSD